MEQWSANVHNYLLALLDNASRIDRTFFSLLAEGANTTDWNQSRIEKVSDNRGTKEF